ncbi:hypothetical protein CCP2SC5_1300005 [Azospirillaceae bacterium]
MQTDNLCDGYLDPIYPLQLCRRAREMHPAAFFSHHPDFCLSCARQAKSRVSNGV